MLGFRALLSRFAPTVLPAAGTCLTERGVALPFLLLQVYDGKVSGNNGSSGGTLPEGLQPADAEPKAHEEECSRSGRSLAPSPSPPAGGRRTRHCFALARAHVRKPGCPVSLLLPALLLQKADVWSCGVLLYVMLLDRYPFRQALLPRLHVHDHCWACPAHGWVGVPNQ